MNILKIVKCPYCESDKNYRTKMYHKIDENYRVVHKNHNIILL